MYKLRNKKLKEARGITLIALVITIIVLLILAGVTISMLTGENGILKEAKNAVIENAHAEVKESMHLEYENYIIEKEQGKNQKDLIGHLKDKKIIEETETEGKYKINVENLLNKQKITTGKGTNGKDVYMLEEIKETGNLGKIASKNLVKVAETAKTSTSKKYKIVYYGEKENRELGILIDGNAKTATEPSPPKEENEEIHKFKVGDYVQLPYNDETIECMVLYDDDYNSNNETNYGIQIITTDVVGDGVTLGGNDVNDIVDTYNNAIEILNDEAKKFVNDSNSKYITSARCVGSVPDKPDSESNEYVDINDEVRIKSDDTNNISDTFQFWSMFKNGVNIVIPESGELYWLASRFCADASMYIQYGLKCSVDLSSFEKYDAHDVDVFYGTWGYEYNKYWFDKMWHEVETDEYTYKIRPVFTINTTSEDKIYGTGTQTDPYRWTENVE